jgi:hypothetical protein
MKLIDDWRAVLGKAWSVRWWAVSAACQAAEMALPLFSDAMPRKWFAGVALLFAAFGMYSRFVKQKDMQ